jgi:hypothetical protein
MTLSLGFSPYGIDTGSRLLSWLSVSNDLDIADTSIGLLCWYSYLLYTTFI